jgi:hypothetical protein
MGKACYFPGEVSTEGLMNGQVFEDRRYTTLICCWLTYQLRIVPKPPHRFRREATNELKKYEQNFIPKIPASSAVKCALPCNGSSGSRAKGFNPCKRNWTSGKRPPWRRH